MMIASSPKDAEEKLVVLGVETVEWLSIRVSSSPGGCQPWASSRLSALERYYAGVNALAQ